MGNGHCYYSGSPLQYSFDESADKGVKVFDLSANGVGNLKDVPLTKGKKLVRLQAESVETALQLLEKYPDHHVELTLFLSAPLTALDSAALAEHSNLTSLLAQIQTDTEMRLETRKGLSDSALFDAYYQSNFQSEPKAELKELFLKTLAEIDGEKGARE